MNGWKPIIGDSGFEVEWCSSIPVDEYGDNNLDAAVYHSVYFKTEDEALTYAKSIYPKDQFGSVQITPFEIDRDEHVPTWPEWHYGESQYYNGEEVE